MTEMDKTYGDEGGCSARAPYALQVLGDDMEPEFMDEAIIIVDPNVPLFNKAYVVIDYDGETTFRQFVVREEKHYLIALKDGSAVELSSEYNLRGVVTQQARSRKNGLKKARHYV
ncbi:MAG TPA: S24 family peptidase [Gammaproteobacteria bacterium]|nr:S24 family peptidase [Gammaproteobacteria bacterium]